MITPRHLIPASALALLALPMLTLASEGGSSAYLQGTYGDFAPALAGPAGFYYRNDLIWYGADVGVRPLGGGINGGAQQTAWINIAKLAWQTDQQLFGGRFALAVALPLVLDVDVEATLRVPGFSPYRGGETRGIGDPQIIPSLNWAGETHHTTASLGIVVPAGKYSEDKLLNLSRNYWAFDPNLSHTYLDARGRELSFTAGVLFNRENPDSDYTTGNEFHLDLMLAQYLSASVGLGLTGYWYEQLTDDDGDVPAVLGVEEGFPSNGIGFGPALMKSQRFCGQDVTFIVKWLHDLDNENRFDGDLMMASFALKL
jgi:hypothetical protein